MDQIDRIKSSYQRDLQPVSLVIVYQVSFVIQTQQQPQGLFLVTDANFMKFRDFS